MKRLSTIEENHCRTTVELSIRFCLWAQQLQQAPSWKRVCTHFGVSRATAYRWIRALNEALAGPDPLTPCETQARRQPASHQSETHS